MEVTVCDFCLLCTKSLQSCLTLCDPMDCSPPGSSVHGILQVKILEWVAMSSSRGSSPPRDWTQVYCISCVGKEVLFFFFFLMLIYFIDHYMLPYFIFIFILLEANFFTILWWFLSYIHMNQPWVYMCEGGSGWGTLAHPWQGGSLPLAPSGKPCDFWE